MAPKKKAAKKTTSKKPATTPVERPVLVTTLHRGVFFGYATETSGETIRLFRARNVVYWHASNRGFLGLAADGPNPGSRVGPAVPGLEVRNVTSVADCTADAAARFEAAPWA